VAPRSFVRFLAMSSRGHEVPVQVEHLKRIKCGLKDD
jgi:hypothetical protein